jgi:two-component system, OmpR family, sensor kinase
MPKLLNKLYLRIWLAVVLAIAVLTMVLGALWRANLDNAPPREVLLRNEAGEVVGSAMARPIRVPGQGVEFAVQMNDGSTMYVQVPPRARAPGEPPPTRPWMGAGGGPRGPGGLWGLLMVIAVVVALATYPIARRLTQRLEALQRGVQRWGEGDLRSRVSEEGNDEVAYLGQRFNQAAARVQALVASHKSLLANASHELRSPLARIRMGLELLPEQASPELRAEIARNIAELDQLVDEILMASRLDSADSDMGPIETLDFSALVAEEGARVGATLDTQVVELQGSARLLRRLVRNLLENARRYSAQAIEVDLRRVDQRIVLRVCDRGPGVPAPERERIFEPFYRASGASEQGGGVGLGLALVKSIAQRHGGQVRCEAREGGGACFVVDLPGQNLNLSN